MREARSDAQAVGLNPEIRRLHQIQAPRPCLSPHQVSNPESPPPTAHVNAH